MADTTKIALSGVVNRLEAVSDVTDIVSTRIYSNVPQQTTFPYIFIELESVPFAQDDDSNMTHLVKVYGFSRKSSQAEALDIAEAVYSALDRQEDNITLSSGSLVNCNFVNNRTVKDSDGVTWFSVSEFTMTID